MTTAGAGFRAHDAEASTQDGQPDDRPRTQAELDYLDQRVEDTATAIKAIKAKIKGMQETLKTAERLHTDAKKARDAGRDLPDVQSRRVA